MDRYELMDRAGIEISEEDYEKVEKVYLESPDFREVCDVVDYIKAHKGSYKGLLERYNDAERIQYYRTRYVQQHDERQSLEAQFSDFKRDAEKTIEEKDKAICLLLSVLTVEQKASLAEILIKGVEA